MWGKALINIAAMETNNSYTTHNLTILLISNNVPNKR